MDVPQITDEACRREWMNPPRKGLLTKEFALEMDVTASAVRAAIRRGKLTGVMLRTRGKVYAYAATVDDVAAYYGLTAEVIDILRRRTQIDAKGSLAWVGIPFFDQSGNTEVPTEFEIRQEFDDANITEPY